MSTVSNTVQIFSSDSYPIPKPIDIVRAYSSRADPNVKQIVVAYDDKEGQPTGNEVCW
jgi:hypothetical protein